MEPIVTSSTEPPRRHVVLDIESLRPDPQKAEMYRTRNSLGAALICAGSVGLIAYAASDQDKALRGT